MNINGKSYGEKVTFKILELYNKFVSSYLIRYLSNCLMNIIVNCLRKKVAFIILKLKITF